MNLRRSPKSTATKLVLEHDPAPGATGFRLSHSLSSRRSHTWDGARTEHAFPVGAEWYKVEALGVVDMGEFPVAPPPLPPTGQGLRFPASANIWGATPQAALTHDLVIANDPRVINPKQARQQNPGLIALFLPSVTGTQPGGFSLTYGSGIMGWGGATDTLQPEPQGPISGYADSDYLRNVDGSYAIYASSDHRGHAIQRPATADLIKRAAFYAWKLGKGAENGWDGLWSDNLLFDTFKAGWAFPNANADLAAWNDGMADVCEYLRARIPVVGGNTAHRTDDPRARQATNASMYEVLEHTIGAGPEEFARRLAEALAWQKAAPGPRLFVVMHRVPASDTAGMRLGLALSCIMSGAYIPYQSHADTYLPAEMKRNGERNYLGLPTGDPVRSGNRWTRQFERGAVSADLATKTSSFG